jgi:hypothetical protein
VAAFDVASGDDDFGALVSEQLGDGGADPAPRSRTGDECGLSIKVHGCVPFEVNHVGVVGFRRIATNPAALSSPSWSNSERVADA